VCQQPAARIGNGNVVWNTQFNRLAFTCGDDSSRVGKIQRQSWSGHVKLLDWHPWRHEITRISAVPLHDGIGLDSHLASQGHLASPLL